MSSLYYTPLHQQSTNISVNIKSFGTTTALKFDYLVLVELAVLKSHIAVSYNNKLHVGTQ